MSERELIEHVLRRSATDPVFRATALHDPVAALAQVARENGHTVDAGLAEAIVFIKTAGAVASTSGVDDERSTFVLPDPSAPGEVDLSQLDPVAGGRAAHRLGDVLSLGLRRIEEGWEGATDDR